MDGFSQQDGHEKSLNFTLKLFRDGFSVPKIAATRKLAITTIENHLLRLLEEGSIKIKELLDESRIEQITKAAECCESLKAVKSRLPGDVSYGEIRYVLMSMGKSKPKKRPIESAVNTYMGNYCQRKCFNHLDVMRECRKRFDLLIEGMGDVSISFRELKKMIDADAVRICKLPSDKKRLYVSWRSFEHLQEMGEDFWCGL